MKWKGSKRYYIAWFYHYNIYAIQDILRDCEVQYKRTSNQYGWHNQPEVATFRAMPYKIYEIECQIKDMLNITMSNVSFPHIYEQDW